MYQPVAVLSILNPTAYLYIRPLTMVLVGTGVGPLGPSDSGATVMLGREPDDELDNV